MIRPQTLNLVRGTFTATIVVTLSISDIALVQAQQPPPPSPRAAGPLQGEPVDGQPVVAGSYRLVVPRHFTVSRLENGTVQVQHRDVTAHIAARQTSGGVATDQLRGLMQAWNPAQPLSPVGAVTTEQPNPGAALAAQQYQQDTGTIGMVHGLFLVYVVYAPGTEALVVDVFAAGPAAEAQDWRALTDFAGALLRNRSFTAPSPTGPRPQPAPRPGSGSEGYIPDPIPTEHLTVNVINRAKHDAAEVAAKIWFDHFPNQPLPSHDAGMIYATILTRLPQDSNSRGPIRELLDRYNRMIDSFGIGR